MELIILS